MQSKNARGTPLQMYSSLDADVKLSVNIQMNGVFSAMGNPGLTLLQSKLLLPEFQRAVLPEGLRQESLSQSLRPRHLTSPLQKNC